MNKPGRLHELCQTDQRYFDRWEKIETERQSEGLGDTVERLLGKAGRKFKRLYRRVFKRDCDCGKRRDALNRMAPYRKLIRLWHGKSSS